MATKLFLRNTANNAIGNFYDMLPTAGSASTTGVVNTSSGTGITVQWTRTAGGTVLEFISGRVPAGGFTLSGTITFSIWAQESSMNANCGGHAKVFKRTSGGTETEIAAADDGVEFGTAATEMTWTVTPISTAFAEDDRIICRYYIGNVGTMASGHTCTLTYNAANAATGDSFFQINENVTFKAEPVAYTMPADPGSYTLTGTVTGLLQGYAVIADPGSYTITGTDAGLLQGYSMTCDPGSYTLTGTDAGLAVAKINPKGTPIYGSGTCNVSGQMTVDVTSLGLVAGDYVIVAYSVASVSNEAAPTCTGNVTGAFTNDADLYSNDLADTNAWTWSRHVTGADTSITFDGTYAAADASYSIRAYTGVDTTTPHDVTLVTATGIDTDRANPASITPVTSGAKIVACYFAQQASSTAAWTAPGNISNWDQVSGGTNFPRVGVGDANWVSGAFDPDAVTGGHNAASESWAAVTYALRPQANQISITADAGIYTYTGTDAALLQGYLVAADPGTYAITGTDAVLAKGRTMVADPGSYAITGTAANLLQGYLVTADPGSYAITGTDAGLSKGIPMVADPGSYTLTGTDAGLLQGYLITADPGSYAITGVATGLLQGYVITADPGSYTLTGSFAILLFSHVITADPGTYTYTGTDAALSEGGAAGTTIVADPGVYTLTGDTVGLLWHHVMPAVPGSYALTGTAAGLFYGRSVSVTPGSYTLNGTDVTFLYSQTLAATPGVYTLTGTDPLLFKSGPTIVAAPGVYTLTGTPALFRYFKITVTPGIYAYTGTAAVMAIGLYSDLVPDPLPLVKFQHNEPEVVRVPKLNEVARQTALNQTIVVAMAELGSIAPTMGSQLHVWDAPSGYSPAYADGMNWRSTIDGSILW